MRMLKSCGPGPFYRRRQYAGKYLVGIGVAAALMALSVGWLVSDAAAQTNDPPDNGAVSVEECLGKAYSPVGPTGQTLAREGVIEENLLPTLVTDDMCGDVLERAQNGGPVQALVAAQSSSLRKTTSKRSSWSRIPYTKPRARPPQGRAIGDFTATCPWSQPWASYRRTRVQHNGSITTAKRRPGVVAKDRE